MKTTPKKLEKEIPCRVCGALHRQPTEVCTDCSHKVAGKVITRQPLTVEFWEIKRPTNRWEVTLATPRERVKLN